MGYPGPSLSKTEANRYLNIRLSKRENWFSRIERRDIASLTWTRAIEIYNDFNGFGLLGPSGNLLSIDLSEEVCKENLITTVDNPRIKIVQGEFWQKVKQSKFPLCGLDFDSMNGLSPYLIDGLMDNLAGTKKTPYWWLRFTFVGRSKHSREQRELFFHHFNSHLFKTYGCLDYSFVKYTGNGHSPMFIGQWVLGSGNESA